jgi:hypothetical protein
MSQLYEKFEEYQQRTESEWSKRLLGGLVQGNQYVGEVFSISYEEALVQIHDRHRQKVGGIPSLSFLVATRIAPDQEEIDYKQEDASVILLRVMDAAPLPNQDEATRVRVQAAQRVSGDDKTHWDEQQAMDAHTHQLLSYAGVECRVLGTFYLKDRSPEDTAQKNGMPLVLRFGSDISNYYPNKGLKVYKPNQQALKWIVNYRDPRHQKNLRNEHEVQVGTVRYASTDRSFQGVSGVDVSIAPADLLGNKTALFGMTRTGKSNTTKIMAKSVFELRFLQDDPMRVGQIIFDPNGEYANENAQDNDNALKNVWRTNSNGSSDEVVTYGVRRHPNDPDRNLMKLNFFADENIQIGKEIIDTALAGDSAKFIKNFRQVYFESPEEEYGGEATRYRRRVLAYRALLAKAGFDVPDDIEPRTSGLFNSDLLHRMRAYEGEGAADYYSAAEIFSSANPRWDQLHGAFSSLHKFMNKNEYEAFERDYVENHSSSGRRWAGEDLKKILAMIYYPNGARQIGDVEPQHTGETTRDYADEIYEHLCEGRLVIVDQSSGDPKINDTSARRVMWRIFDGHRTLFREGKSEEEIPDILIHVEEAHNLLPSSKEDDLQDVWVRTAKEGAKYYLGMAYITQEVSSIQRNILKNTANWFIGHLNNTDETRELRKFYDFADFEPSIRRAQDPGFLRVKTLSNPYVIPVQIEEFKMPSVVSEELQP